MLITDYTRKDDPEHESFVRLLSDITTYEELVVDMRDNLNIPENLETVFKLTLTTNNIGGVSMLRIRSDKDWNASLEAIRHSFGAELQVHCAQDLKRSVQVGGYRSVSSNGRMYKVSNAEKLHARLDFAESGYGANAGLSVARALLEPIKACHPDITYADLWTFAGCVSIEAMGGPNIRWRPGRADAEDGSKCPVDGRLPNADMGSVGKTIQHIRDIFYRMGFNDKEIVALCGAHALGQCHTDRSGYTGPWTRAETTFSNEYFRELLENTWTLKKWDGPEQFEDPTGELMMLPSDMALLWDKDFRRHATTYAENEEIFFKDFAKAFAKLIELGVPAFNRKPWYKPWLFLM